MLFDLGLQTEEQIAKHKEMLSRRFDGSNVGCISQRICENCNHLISDSICLCVPCFICPNCKFENGQNIKKMVEESNKNIKYGFVSPAKTDRELIDELIIRIEKKLDQDIQWAKFYKLRNLLFDAGKIIAEYDGRNK